MDLPVVTELHRGHWSRSELCPFPLNGTPDRPEKNCMMLKRIAENGWCFQLTITQGPSNSSPPAILSLQKPPEETSWKVLV